MKFLEYLYEDWAVWFAFAVFGSFVYVCKTIQHSRAMLETDLSAMAWTAFLPFIYPIFLGYALAATLAIMLVYKLIYFLCKRYL